MVDTAVEVADIDGDVAGGTETADATAVVEADVPLVLQCRRTPHVQVRRNKQD